MCAILIIFVFTTKKKSTPSHNKGLGSSCIFLGFSCGCRPSQEETTVYTSTLMLVLCIVLGICLVAALRLSFRAKTPERLEAVFWILE